MNFFLEETLILVKPNVFLLASFCAKVKVRKNNTQRCEGAKTAFI
jgi:hypothetical protein